MNLMLALPLALIVASCGIAARQQQQEAQAARETRIRVAVQFCKDRFPEKPAVPLARCYNQVEDIVKEIAPFPDLINSRQAKRLELAERVDRREITPIQAESLLADHQTRVASESENRSATRRAVSAQETAAEAQRTMALPPCREPHPGSPLDNFNVGLARSQGQCR